MLHVSVWTHAVRTVVPSAALLFLTSAMPAAAPAVQESFLVGDWPNPAHPVGNEQDADRARLGKALFWDEQLSHPRTMACGTCHIPAAGGGDPRTTELPAEAVGLFGSPGVIHQDQNGDYVYDGVFGFGRQITSRNAPTVIGAAFFKRLFWDLTALEDFTDESGTVVLEDVAALESVAVRPPVSPVEMGHDGIMWAEVVAKLEGLNALALATVPPNSDFSMVAGQPYSELFESAFGGPITRENVAKAIAQYLRTLVPDQAPIDSGLNNLPPSVTEGFNLFNEMRGPDNEPIPRCSFCHASSLDLDSRILLNGGDGTFRRSMDNVLSGGEAENALADLDMDLNNAKVHTLRNVALLTRLESQGRFAGLEDALQSHFFTDNPIDPQFTFGSHLRPDQKDAVRDFFDALTDPRVANETYPFDRPVLYSERVPFQSNHLGVGSASPTNGVPVIIANAPPKIGNDDFKLGVGGGDLGANAFLYYSPTAMSVVVAGVHWEIDPSTATLIDAVVLSGTIAGKGAGTSHLPIPEDPGLVGQTLYFQWLVQDAGAPGGYATTQAAEIDYF